MSDKQIALVTGATKGIGRAVAEGLVAKGLLVIITGRNLAEAEAVAAVIGDGAVGVALDVTSDASVATLKEMIIGRFGKLDILVANAGIALDHWQKALDVPLDTFRETMETNFLGVIRCCQAFAPMMVEAGFGRIVTVSSELGSLSGMQMAGSPAYRTSKTALNGFTKLLSLEVAGQGDLLVNAACPGWVRTALGGPEAPRTPEEGADTIIWLATLPEGGPSGGLFRDREPFEW